MLKKVLQPILFQGHLKKTNYFEGWYFKQITADQNISLRFIPAVSLNNNDLHSFIQYILVESDDHGQKTIHMGMFATKFLTFLMQRILSLSPLASQPLPKIASPFI